MAKTTDPHRDKNGRMLPGHPFFPSQTGKKNGRPRSLKRQVMDELGIARDNLPGIATRMIQRATGELPDTPQAVQQAASEYLWDRIYGKPNQPLSNRDGSPITSFVFVLPNGQQLSARELFESRQSALSLPSPTTIVDAEVITDNNDHLDSGGPTHDQ
jgi:hypothetical protein